MNIETRVAQDKKSFIVVSFGQQSYNSWLILFSFTNVIVFNNTLVLPVVCVIYSSVMTTQRRTHSHQTVISLRLSFKVKWYSFIFISTCFSLHAVRTVNVVQQQMRNYALLNYVATKLTQWQNMHFYTENPE